MQDFELARETKLLLAGMDRHQRPEPFTQQYLWGAPTGAAYVTVSPREAGEFASGNHNRVYLCGAEDGLNEEGPARFKALFQAAGVARYFVWLAPGPELDQAQRWLLDAGLMHRKFVSYVTLSRDAAPPDHVTGPFVVRELGVGEAAGFAPQLGSVAWPEFVRCADAPGFRHFAAFLDGKPAATAYLYQRGRTAYLGGALTAETLRNRGAHKQLIAARIAAAHEAGCAMLISETLSLAPASQHNLNRAGFATGFEYDVFEGRAA